jgi:hypothetical protein
VEYLAVGRFNLFDGRPVDVGGPSHSSRSGRASANPQRVRLTFIAAWFGVTLSMGALAYALGGRDEFRRALLAQTACLPGAAISLLAFLRAQSLPASVSTVIVLAGTPLRLLSTLLLSTLIWCGILSMRGAGFWGWIVVGYCLSLAIEVWLMLRVLRSKADPIYSGGA